MSGRDKEQVTMRMRVQRRKGVSLGEAFVNLKETNTGKIKGQGGGDNQQGYDLIEHRCRE